MEARWMLMSLVISMVVLIGLSAAKPACNPGQFQCPETDPFIPLRCIPIARRFDGVPDCPDGADEDEGYEVSSICPSGKFDCGFGEPQCILLRLRCDGEMDCVNGTDEEKCDACLEDQFACGNGECVYKAFVCDNDNDCGDRSDETDCPPVTCAPDYFQCEDTSSCIPERWKCDGDSDCDDLSDEAETLCNPVMLGCANEEFQCLTGECLHGSWRCDGDIDCNDGSDEAVELCGFPTCAGEEFQCLDGGCIDISWKCDSDIDCGDGSDEAVDLCGSGNSGVPTCAGEEFQCLNGDCIHGSWTCDSDVDCIDGSDEADDVCHPEDSGLVACEVGEFQCFSGECVQGPLKCDGEKDCSDGSDESPSVCQPGSSVECAVGEYRCSNGSCVPDSYECDGIQQCSDGSDELDCENAHNCNIDTEFPCSISTCIPVSKVCDGIVDCPNGEDEVGEGVCDLNECLMDNGGCQHVCIDRPYGRLCSCREGYTLVNGTKCVSEVNECERMPGICSQRCINSGRGDYECVCDDEYILEQVNDRGHCRSKPLFGHPQVVVANRAEIRIYDTVTVKGDVVTTDPTGAIAVDVDMWSNTVFWTDIVSDQLHSLPLVSGRSSTPRVVMSDIETVDDIAVDWVNKLLYWTDVGRSHIKVCTYDGLKKAVLINSDLDQPRAIVIDPRSGFMFWSDWGADARIERAGMHGKERHTIVTEGIGWPNGLTIDYTLDQLYWTDAKEDSISVADFFGGNRRLLVTGMRHPFGITVFEDFIYWTDWRTESVDRADKFTGSNRITVIPGLSTPMGLEIVHPLRQPRVTDGVPCSHDNGMCSYMCVTAPRVNGTASYSCLCKENVSLSSDGHTCDGDTPRSRFL